MHRRRLALFLVTTVVSGLVGLLEFLHAFLALSKPFVVTRIVMRTPALALLVATPPFTVSIILLAVIRLPIFWWHAIDRTALGRFPKHARLTRGSQVRLLKCDCP